MDRWPRPAITGGSGLSQAETATFCEDRDLETDRGSGPHNLGRCGGREWPMPAYRAGGESVTPAGLVGSGNSLVCSGERPGKMGSHRYGHAIRRQRFRSRARPLLYRIATCGPQSDFP